MEALYISRNNFESLSFVQKLELPFLKNFSIHTSHIKEFEPLKKFKTLEEIDMRDNYVNNIDSLLSFTRELINLKEFNLSGNDIDLNIQKNKQIFDLIKSEKRIKLVI